MKAELSSDSSVALSLVSDVFTKNRTLLISHVHSLCGNISNSFTVVEICNIPGVLQAVWLCFLNIILNNVTCHRCESMMVALTVFE